jgi:predicted nucleotidyltransferase
MLREIPVSQKQLDAFCQRHHIRQLALFGSYLRDDFGPESDIDVLVEFESDAQIGFLALARIQRELSELLGRKVDIVPVTGLKSSIRDDVLKESEVVYMTQESSKLGASNFNRE